MGPISYMSMMRFESKRSALKLMGKKANNFKNITKTISTRHQAELAYKGFTFVNNMCSGKLSRCELELVDNAQYIEIIKNSFDQNLTIMKTKWCTLNNFTYKQQNVIIVYRRFWKIENILIVNQQHYFLCSSVDVISFDSFTHSKVVETQNSPEILLISLEAMDVKQPFNIIYSNGKMHIFADTLEVSEVN